MLPRIAVLAALAWIFLQSNPIHAQGLQAQRYELGRRLRAFETAWERAPGDAARQRCVAPLNQAVSAFFSLRFGEAGRSLDQARLALDGDGKPSSGHRFAESLALYPATRLVDAKTTELTVELQPFYEIERPNAELSLQLRLLKAGQTTAAMTASIEKLPRRFHLPLKVAFTGDLVLDYAIVAKQQTLAKGSMTVSIVDRLAERLAGLAEMDGGEELAAESATLKSTVKLLTRLLEGKSEETDYPAARLLTECEQIAKSLQAKARWFTQRRSGAQWLTLTSEKTKQRFPLRILVPAEWNAKSPPPLVVAMHGAGGSENMFFDAYGAGKIVKLCAARGWMLVAPRVSFGFQLAPMLTALHARYPFDSKRVFVLGHSMGAAQAIGAASIEPRRYSAIVALGGSGVFKESADLQRVPFFVGVGTRDFALSGARSLKDRLIKAGVEKVVYRELAEIEHLGIVQQSLGEAFAFLDEIGEPDVVKAPNTDKANSDKALTWPQWRGPTRDGKVNGPKWPERLAGDSLKQLWRVPLGPSYSGPIVADDLVFTTQTVNKESEVVSALDRGTGKERWQSKWKGAMTVPFFAAANGSWIRSTPAHDGENLYVAGIRDVLVCLDAKTGEEKWRVNFVADFKTPLPAFGCVSSPLIDGNDLYIQAGASIVKLDKRTGKTLWRTLKDEGGMNGSAFSSPVIAELAGRRQLVAQARAKLAGIDLGSGEVLWSQVVPSFRGMNILTPTVIGDGIFTSSYGNKSWLYSIAGDKGAFTVKESWTGKPQAYMSSPVVIDGHAYLHLQNRRFTCIDLKTGTPTWTTEPFGQYWSMVTQGSRILALDQTGTLRLIQADPKRFRLLDSREISKDETWAHLAVCGDEIFVRELNALAAYRWIAAQAP